MTSRKRQRNMKRAAAMLHKRVLIVCHPWGEYEIHARNGGTNADVLAVAAMMQKAEFARMQQILARMRSDEIKITAGPVEMKRWHKNGVQWSPWDD